MAPADFSKKKSKKKKKKQTATYIVEEVTDRDIRMASAYGGVAKPRLRKVTQRFATIKGHHPVQLASQTARQSGAGALTSIEKSGQKPWGPGPNDATEGTNDTLRSGSVSRNLVAKAGSQQRFAEDQFNSARKGDEEKRRAKLRLRKKNLQKRAAEKYD